MLANVFGIEAAEFALSRGSRRSPLSGLGKRPLFTWEN